LLRFVGYGLIFVLVPEFTNLVVIHRDPAGYLGALAAYAVLLLAGYGVQRLVDRVLPGPVLTNGIVFLISGVSGLALEWFAIGNSPWENPDAIQWGMFVYWVGLFMLPRLLVDDRPGLEHLQRDVKIGYLIYMAIHLLLALTLPVQLLPFLIPLLWTIVYTLCGVFYVRYVRILHSVSGPPVR